MFLFMFMVMGEELLIILSLKVHCRVRHVPHHKHKPPKPPSSHEKSQSPLKEPLGFRGPIRGGSSGLQ